MLAATAGGILSAEQKRQFEEDGYLIVRGVFSPLEVEHIKGTFMQLHALGPNNGCSEAVPGSVAADDPLRLYPRMLYPHRSSDTVKKYMIHPVLMSILADLLGEEPLAAQSMFYFKPPGGRGQALHQDNYYLRVEPGTCIAAWTAVDPADEENGGLVVVPKTNRLDIECPHEADPSVSYFRDEVNLPEGSAIVPANLLAGDVLFFNGSTIHGSFPNRSKDRFRRSFICHYVGESTARLGRHIHDDLVNARGATVVRDKNEDGGPCGTAFGGAPH